jgi:hypothetical protein
MFFKSFPLTRGHLTEQVTLDGKISDRLFVFHSPLVL